MGSVNNTIVPHTLKLRMLSQNLSFMAVALCLINLSGPVTSASLPKKILYLTFDDGPNQGTPLVLDVLKKHNVPATFFINSINLHEWYKNEAEKLVLRTVQEGHTLADHSYDHMKHNNYDYQQNYKSMQTDLDYFGEKNSKPVLDVMRRAIADWGQEKVVSHSINFVNFTMNTFVRLPYTNAWRVGDIRADCASCTVPASSGQIGIQLSDALAGAGKYVFGWDQEWSTNYAINRPLYAGGDMFRKLKFEKTKSPGKLVLLMHDYAFRPSHSATELDVTELDNFIGIAKQNGYTFSTIDKYLQDDPFTTVQ